MSALTPKEQEEFGRGFMAGMLIISIPLLLMMVIGWLFL